LKQAILYTIVPKDLAAHLFEVTLTVAEPHVTGQEFTLPAWIPGSYMVREFARHIIQISAESAGRKVRLTKLDKHRWQAAPCNQPLTLRYEIYAWDLSVRAAHLDQTHGFFNGTSVFLQVIGQEQSRHEVDIQKSTDAACNEWRVATSLPRLKAKKYAFGTYTASNYDELIDHPVEMGDFALATFQAHGVPHDIVITGTVPNLDMARLCADLQKICEAHITLFEPISRKAPMDRYVFMTLAMGEGYGGLEHRASTALICARADLPVKGQAGLTDGYRTYLGLCSHEYFHTWNIKRIKPEVFVSYQLHAETYTSLLWLFEGFTSYYDDLMLVRSGVIDEAAYFSLVAKTLNSVLRGSGRTKQSVAESSFDTWIKYYRQDENAPNALTSYYTKGSLIGLAFDLTIRAESDGSRSLDDVMRALWSRFGRDFYVDGMPQRGVSEAEVEALFEEVSGVKMKRLFDRWVRGTDDLPVAKLLITFGVVLTDNRKEGLPALGVRAVRDGPDCKLANVYEGGAAHRCGLSANDVLIAFDGLRVNANNYDILLGRYKVGDVIEVHAFRRDELMRFKATLTADASIKTVITSESKFPVAVKLRESWLHQTKSTDAKRKAKST
jgi:predicted metalloprotease with PDZ domain